VGLLGVVLLAAWSLPAPVGGVDGAVPQDGEVVASEGRERESGVVGSFGVEVMSSLSSSTARSGSGATPERTLSNP
jgi:hypothetical protein